MAKHQGGGHSSHAAETTLHQKGMKVREPKFPDASMRCKGGSVNSDTTRKSVPAQPKSLGPREA
jgi:hypothetical protein